MTKIVKNGRGCSERALVRKSEDEDTGATSEELYEFQQRLFVPENVPAMENTAPESTSEICKLTPLAQSHNQSPPEHIKNSFVQVDNFQMLTNIDLEPKQ